MKLGIVPGVISPFVLGEDRRRPRRAATSSRASASTPTALRIGLVHELADDLDAAVDRVVGELLTAGRGGDARREDARHAPRSRMEETARLIAESRAGAEGQEGLRAFLAGRRPGRAGFASWCPPAEDA